MNGFAPSKRILDEDGQHHFVFLLLTKKNWLLRNCPFPVKTIKRITCTCDRYGFFQVDKSTVDTWESSLFSLPISPDISGVARLPMTGVAERSKVKSKVLPGRSFLIIIASADQELSCTVHTELAGRAGGVSKCDEWDTAIFNMSSDSFHRLPQKGQGKNSSNMCNNIAHHTIMAGSPSGQDEAKTMIWLAPRTDKMGISCPPWIACFDQEENILFRP